MLHSTVPYKLTTQTIDVVNKLGYVKMNVDSKSVNEEASSQVIRSIYGGEHRVWLE
jgi:hypothetical protein